MVGLGAAGIGGLYYAFSLTRAYTWQTLELERLQEENQRQHFELQGVARKMSLLNDQMERFENFHTRFRMLAEKDLGTDRTKHSRTRGSFSDGGLDTDMYTSSIFPKKSLLREAEQVYLELEELRSQSLQYVKSMYKIEDVLGLDQPMSLSHPISTPGLGFRFLWPTNGRIMSHYGKRISPITGEWTRHDGIDISARIGTPVRATADGVVLFRGWDGAYGNTILIDHGQGYVSRYAHLSHMYVKQGDNIHRGDIIGTVGTSGNATGPHLHFEVNAKGRTLNPLKLLKLKD